jgi:histidinol-phosphate aminotransferase
MSLFRPDIERIAGYVPGEQPRETGWVKLNTNENPYPPSPKVVAAIEAAAHTRLNVYPDPFAKRFRELVAELFDVDPDWILPANGSDENLTIIMRSFVDRGQRVAYPYPSYILYETLAEIQGASWVRLQLNADWTWNHNACRPLIEQSKLVLVPNPNSPSGTRWSDDDILALLPPQGVLVLDEAYGDFCDDPHRGQLLQSDAGKRIIITRTLSKSYSLAGIRMGFSIAHPDLTRGMLKVKDSYNCNTLSLAAGAAALEDQQWMKDNAQRIRRSRLSLATSLDELGFRVADSQANFVWATHRDGRHQQIFEELKRRRILVRYMQFAGSNDDELDGLRITVGTEDELSTFVNALREIV